MTFVEYAQNGTGTATLSGVVDGTNTLFTLKVVPTELQVYLNGVFQVDEALGLSVWDITWSPGGFGTQTATITFNSTSIPQTGDIVLAWVYIAQP